MTNIEQINANRAKVGLPPIDASSNSARNSDTSIDEKFATLTEKLKQRKQQAVNPVQSQINTGRNALMDANVGVLKGGLSTAVGASSLGERIVGSIGKTILPKSAEKFLGVENAPDLNILEKVGLRQQTGNEKMTGAKQIQTREEQKRGLQPGQLTTPLNTAQKVGFGAEQVAEFLVPGSAALKGSKAIGGASKLGRIGSLAGLETVIGTGQLGMQSGDIGKEELKYGTIGGLTAGVLTPAFEKLLKSTGILSRAPKEWIDKSTAQMKKAFPELKTVENKLGYFAEETGQDPFEYLVSHGVPIRREGSVAKVDVGMKRLKEIENYLGESRDFIFNGFANKPPTIQKTTLFGDAVRRIQSDVLTDEETKRKAIQKIEKVLSEEKSMYNPKTLTDRKTFWGSESKAKFDKPVTTVNQSAYQALAGAAKDLAEKEVQRVLPEYGNILKDTNAELQKAILAKKVLQTLENTKIKKGFLGQDLARISGNIIGAPLGPFGSYITGETIARFQKYVNNPEMLSEKAISNFIKSGEIPSFLKNREKVLEFMRGMIKQELESPGTLALPQASKGTSAGNIYLPPTSESARLKSIQDSGIISRPSPAIQPQTMRSGQLQLPAGRTSGTGFDIQPTAMATPAPTIYEPPAKVISGRGQSPLSSLRYPSQTPLLPPGTGMTGKPMITPSPVIEGEIAPKSFSTPAVGEIARPPKASSKVTPIEQSITKAKAEGKNFDEWVKGQGEPLYHGTGIEFDKFNLDKSQGGGIWFSNRKDLVKSGEVGAGSQGRIIENILDEKNVKLADWDLYDSKTTDELINMGYDGVKLKDGDVTTFSLFTQKGIDELKTKSQLKELWNKSFNK